ncbi:MAG: helix-turn-helix transcriptional regulator [Acidisphaera sp.]|nr:helix-turn-helix transcriptional regulator [Acidisphaera sp.]MBV9813150.1 helix-turn-helix transcriptional regulator [Acetobacteraceae bacterium]
MVKYHADQLDRTFAALSDATRRVMLARLAEQPGLSVTALARPFPLKLPTVMKHLDVLDHAGLIARRKSGRVVSVTLRPEPMAAALEWMRRYERFWSGSLDRLAALLEDTSE